MKLEITKELIEKYLTFSTRMIWIGIETAKAGTQKFIIDAINKKLKDYSDPSAVDKVIEEVGTKYHIPPKMQKIIGDAIKSALKDENAA